MEQFLAFYHNNTLLCSAFLGVFIGIIILEIRTRSNSQAITPQEATNLINRQHAQVVDIRGSDAFAQGHVAGSKNCEKDKVGADEKQRNKLAKNPLIIVCDTGTQAMVVCNRLISQGLKDVYCLQGGIRAWSSEQLPLVKG